MICRSLAVICLIWAVSEIVTIPTDLLAISHHIQVLHGTTLTAYGASAERFEVRFYAAFVLQHFILFLATLWLARWLYHGGEGVRKFFAVD